MKIYSATLLFFAGACASAQYYAPTPYLKASDSPIASNITSLENFEDGLLNTPNVSASSGLVSAPGSLTDSVDGDDGAIDGSGQAGRSWYSGGTNNVTFTFSGALPKYVGVVVTDVGTTQFGTFGSGVFTFRAFDSSNTLIGTGTNLVIGDGSVGGQTAEDRFTGVFWEGGVSKIEVGFLNSTDWEIDHLQYGSVPEPATCTALAMGTLAIWRRRR